ncbi:MAG: hypothetical protein H6Q69_3176 [Firmicutes bacterium]|nr:hypothetical protein [Bacillota bacterium]
MKYNMKLIEIPYGSEVVRASVPDDSVVFDGIMPKIPSIADLEAAVLEKIDNPSGCKPLKEIVSKSDRILILIEDNTRQTPVKRILPVLISYLENNDFIRFFAKKKSRVHFLYSTLQKILLYFS